MLSNCFGRAAAVPQFGWTALMYAAKYGHTKAVSVLVGAGAALDAVDKVGLCRAAACPIGLCGVVLCLTLLSTFVCVWS